MSDPWGRDPDDVNDENLNDLYDKNRPPSTTSVDKWGQNDDEFEENPKPKAISRPTTSGTKVKSSSRPSSQLADEQPADDDTFTRNRTPQPQSRTTTPISQSKQPGSKPSTPDTSEFSQNRNPDSKPSTPDGDGFRENRQSNSKPGTPSRANSRNQSKPGTPTDVKSRSQSKPGSPTSRPQSKPNSPTPKLSRPSSLEIARRSKEPGESVPKASRTSSPVTRSSTPVKTPVSSRPSSKTSVMENSKKPNSSDGPLRSDSKRIRDDNLPLPNPVHKEEIRKRAFDNMKNKKAHPSYLFTKFPHVIEALMRYLPFRSLCKAQSVCRAWYKVGKDEKQRRNFIDSDCYKLELTKDDVADEQDDDLQIDLYKIMDEMFVQPTTILAFMTWRTVTTIPDILFRILPLHCASTCVASEIGVVGTRKNGKIRIYTDNVHESCSVLFIPKLDKFQIYPFSSFRPDQLKFDERYFDSIGLKKYEEKKQIKCLMIFCCGGKTRNSNEVTLAQLEKWEKEFQNSFQCRTALIGACVNFSQHGLKKIFGNNSKLYSTENDVNGVAFQGENLEVMSLVFDKIDDNISDRLDLLDIFVGRSPSNSFAIILNSFQDGEEKRILKKFKSVLPNTRIAGLRTNGLLFGQNFNSYDDRTSQRRQSIFLGQCLILIIFKVSKNFKLTKNRNNNNKESNSANDKKILQGYRVK